MFKTENLTELPGSKNVDMLHVRNKKNKNVKLLIYRISLNTLEIIVLYEFMKFLAKKYGKCTKVAQPDVERDVNGSCQLFTSLCLKT